MARALPLSFRNATRPMHKASRGSHNPGPVIRRRYFPAPGNETSTLLTLIGLVVSGVDVDAH
jgi:hypothetical protein